jgi:hypothetical protein
MNTHSKRTLHLSIAALCAVAMALLMPLQAHAQVYIPGGRLTLVSNTPVMAADASGPTVYYTAYVGSNVPLAIGTTLQNSGFASQLTLNLNPSLHKAGDIYDIFIVNNSGSLTLCTGPAWKFPPTKRGTGPGTTQLVRLNGLSVNARRITCLNGSISLFVAAKFGFYLGSVYMTANGQTSMRLKPAATAGGTDNVLGLWNAYNRVRVTAYSRDNTSN